MSFRKHNAGAWLRLINALTSCFLMWSVVTLPIILLMLGLWEWTLNFIQPYWIVFSDLWNSEIIDSNLLGVQALPYAPHFLPEVNWNYEWLALISLQYISSALCFMLFIHLLTPVRWDLKHLGQMNLIKKGTSLHQLIHNTIIKTGLNPKKIRAVWIDSDDVNAFAYSKPGRKPVIALTVGLLSIMDDKQIEWILAHELGHIHHGDSGASAIWQAVLRSNYYLRWIQYSVYRIIMPIVSILPIIRVVTSPLNYLLRISIWFSDLLNKATVFLFKISDCYTQRLMEYGADSFATHYIGANSGVSALLALNGNGFELTMNIFASHPSIQSRVAAIQKNTKG